MIYNFVVMQEDVYPYFNELIEVLKGGLEDLGHEVLIGQHYSNTEYKNIILAAHLCSTNFIEVFPKNSIILQTEPLMTDEEGRRLWNDRMKKYAKHFETWEYSLANLPILKDAGAINVKYLPIGYHKSINRIPKSQEQDINILFYGSTTERRKEILDRLPKGTSVVFNVFGDERDNLIARSKIVLNLRSTDKGTSFESIRVSYLLANGKAVVSESPKEDTIYDGGYKSVPYSNIVQTCEELLANPLELIKLEKKALSTIKKYPQKDLLKPLLD